WFTPQRHVYPRPDSPPGSDDIARPSFGSVTHHPILDQSLKSVQGRTPPTPNSRPVGSDRRMDGAIPQSPRQLVRPGGVAVGVARRGPAPESYRRGLAPGPRARPGAAAGDRLRRLARRGALFGGGGPGDLVARPGAARPGPGRHGPAGPGGDRPDGHRPGGVR